ncbi:MAG TPA: multidrug efflux SMR transporter [Casimicrobiaceae bacterium]|nr:multidrug efflux SMR transporter [Casimicrobiaceae bacterium]
MHWFLLGAAILCEVAGTVSMRLAQGFTRPVPSVMLFVFYACSFVLMTLVVRRIEVSITYAIWSGVGTAVIAVIGVFYFKETLTIVQVASMGLIILGVVGLRLGAAPAA